MSRTSREDQRRKRGEVAARVRSQIPELRCLGLVTTQKGSQVNEPILEPAARDLPDATAKSPFLYELGPEGARKVLDGRGTQPPADNHDHQMEVRPCP